MSRSDLPHAQVSPYLGAGIGSYFWSLEEEGDFIDRNDDIFFATLQDEGVAFGYYYLIGLEAPITRRMSIFGEGRWDQADDELSDDFEGSATWTSPAAASGSGCPGTSDPEPLPQRQRKRPVLARRPF